MMSPAWKPAASSAGDLANAVKGWQDEILLDFGVERHRLERSQRVLLKASALGSRDSSDCLDSLDSNRDCSDKTDLHREGPSVITWILRVCAILASMIAFFISWTGFTENREFDAHGQRALVEPLAQYTERTTTTKELGVAVGESKLYSADLSFTTQDDQHIQVNRGIPDDVLAAFQSGADVYLEYLPESPMTTRFEGHAAQPLLAAAAGVAIGVLTWLLWRKM
jgi:hypothetical protein